MINSRSGQWWVALEGIAPSLALETGQSAPHPAAFPATPSLFPVNAQPNRAACAASVLAAIVS
jgi:hypothetical protein